MTPYEELFNTANSRSIVHSNERLEAIAFAQNLYHTLVRKWEIPEGRVRLFPPFGEFNPDMTYFPAGATVNRPGGGWSLGIQVTFAPPSTDNSTLLSLGPSVVAKIRIDFLRENGSYSVEAANTEATIQPDVLEDYESFADSLFADVKNILVEEPSDTTRRIGFRVDPASSKQKSLADAFPVIPGGQWSDDISLRREDMYDETGR